MERREDSCRKNPIIAKFVLTMYAFGLSLSNLHYFPSSPKEAVAKCAHHTKQGKKHYETLYSIDKNEII